jgi:hypothetical protein
LRTVSPIKAACKNPPSTGIRGPTISLRLRSDAVIRRVEATPQGERNKLLYWAACRFGEMIGEGVIQRAVAERLLEGAARSNGLWKDDGQAQCRATIHSGIDAGMQDGDGRLLHAAFKGNGKAVEQA